MAQLVKSLSGLAIASVKSVEGLAIASVKSIMGLDNTASASGPDYFGSASTPADNGAQAGNTAFAVTPPASMASGDVALVFLHARTTGVSDLLQVTTKGGQVWQRIGLFPQTTCSAVLYACRFNGTWGTNPEFQNINLDATAMTAVMHVFRPSSGMFIDMELITVNPSAATFNNTGTTKTVSALTSLSNNCMAVAAWFISDDVTISGLTGSAGTWTAAGSTQYRNTTGSDQASTYAYQKIATAGTTGTASVTESIATAGSMAMVILREIVNPNTATKPTVQVFTDFEASTNGVPITTTILGSGTHSGGETWTWQENNPAVPFYFTATAAETALGNSLVQNGTTYDDTGATRGFNMDFSVVTALSTSYYAIVRSATVSKLSASITFSTNVPQEFWSYTCFGITNGSSTGGVFISTQTYAAATYEMYAENTVSATNRGPDGDPQLTTKYRLSLMYDDPNNIGAFGVFDTSNNQIGFTTLLRPDTTNPAAPDRIYIGQFGGGQGHTVSANMYMDDLMINTSGVYPLLPGT